MTDMTFFNEITQIVECRNMNEERLRVLSDLKDSQAENIRITIDRIGSLAEPALVETHYSAQSLLRAIIAYYQNNLDECNKELDKYSILKTESSPNGYCISEPSDPITVAVDVTYIGKYQRCTESVPVDSIIDYETLPRESEDDE